MNGDLQRRTYDLDIDVDMLSKSLVGLPEEEQVNLLSKYGERLLQIKMEALKKYSDSKIADHDLESLIRVIERLETEKKVYSASQKQQIGSGTRNITIKGGDTRFILPVLIVIAVILVGIAFVIFRN
jgi:hypothetical protein